MKRIEPTKDIAAVVLRCLDQNRCWGGQAWFGDREISPRVSGGQLFLVMHVTGITDH